MADSQFATIPKRPARWLSGITIVALVFGLAAQHAAAQADDAFKIVSPDWLAEHNDDDDVRVIDVRTSVAQYQQGHVPGAVFLANDALRAPMAGVPVQYLDPEDMASLFRRAGVNHGDMVVLYADGDDVLGATMAAYALHRIGHTRTAILNGGLQAWAGRYPTTQAYPDAPMGNLSPQLNPNIRATIEDVRAAMDDPAAVILDTRPAKDYLGNTTRWMRNGHIPGAVNIDWHQLMEPANPHQFRSDAAMAALIESTGVQKSDNVIVYCGTSREATLVVMVMRHRLGYENVRLYEGSWTEYCSLMDMPVEREPAGTAGATHTPPSTAELEPYQCGTVKRLHTLAGVFLASQPSPEDFQQARMGGVRTVINLRHASENRDFDEQAIVSDLGLNYFNPAWNGPDELTDHVLDRARQLLREAQRPVLMHCSSANRVGAVWLAYRVLDSDLPVDAALAEARTVGLKSPDYERIVLDYIARRSASR